MGRTPSRLYAGRDLRRFRRLAASRLKILESVEPADTVVVEAAASEVADIVIASATSTLPKARSKNSESVFIGVE